MARFLTNFNYILHVIEWVDYLHIFNIEFAQCYAAIFQIDLR